MDLIAANTWDEVKAVVAQATHFLADAESEIRWVRYAWTVTAAGRRFTDGTAGDHVQLKLRAAALCALASEFCERIYHPDEAEGDWRYGVDRSSLVVGPSDVAVIEQLAERSGLTLEGEAFDPEDVTWILVELIARLGWRLAKSLRDRLGDVRLFTELHSIARPWDYSYGDDRSPVSYPLPDDLIGEQARVDLYPELRSAYEWITSGMPL